MALEFYDTFTRVEASGLGVSDSGHTWTVSGTGDASVDGFAGALSLTADNLTLRGMLDAVTESDVEMYAQFVLSDPPAGDVTSLQLAARYTSTTTFVSGVLGVNPDGTTSLGLRNNNTAFATGAGPDWDGATLFNMRYRVVGNSYRLKVWFGEDPEPTNWTLSYTYVSGNVSGTCGFRVHTGPASTVTLPYVVGIEEATFGTATLGSDLIDTFSREVVPGGWGTSDTDNTWTVALGTASRFSVPSIGNAGKIDLTNDGAVQAITANLSMTDFHLEGDFSVAVTPLSNVQVGYVARRTDASNYFWFYLTFSTTNTISVTAAKTIAGVTTVLGTTALGSFVNLDKWTLVAEVIGSSIKVKAWKTGTAEPAAWTLTFTDAVQPPEFGNVGIRALRAASGSASAHTSSISNLSFRNVFPSVLAEAVDEPDSPSVRLTISNGDVYELIRVERVYLDNSAASVPVRGFDGVSVPGGVVSVHDYEAPLDEIVIYRVYTMDADLNVISVAESDPVALLVPYHRVIIRSVGQPTLSLRVQITSFPTFNQELRILQDAKVLGRKNPVILFDVMEGMTGNMSFMTLLDQDPTGIAIRKLLSEGQPLLFQSVSRVTGVPDFYFAATGVAATRKTTIRAEDRPRYVYSVEFQEVDRPPSSSESLGFFAWQSLLDVEHLEWQSVDDTFTSWLEVLNFANRTPA